MVVLRKETFQENPLEQKQKPNSKSCDRKHLTSTDLWMGGGFLSWTLIYDNIVIVYTFDATVLLRCILLIWNE